MGRRILVTGGAGFIGSFLCEALLSRGLDVLCVDNFFDRTFFVTSVTWERRPIFRSDRAAFLFLETLFGYRDRGIFRLYEFVVMPDHIHMLLAPRPTVALERAMQFVKGGFSYRLSKTTGSRMEVWSAVSRTIAFGTMRTMETIGVMSR